MRSIARNVALEMALQQRAMGRRIAQLRERAHLTQEAAADRAGVTLRAYQKWEAGGGIQYANLQKLADALRTTVEEVTGDAETPSPFKVGDQMEDGFEEFRQYVRDIRRDIADLAATIQTITDAIGLTGPDATTDALARARDLTRRLAEDTQRSREASSSSGPAGRAPRQQRQR